MQLFIVTLMFATACSIPHSTEETVSNQIHNEEELMINTVPWSPESPHFSPLYNPSPRELSKDMILKAISLANNIKARSSAAYFVTHSDTEGELQGKFLEHILGFTQDKKDSTMTTSRMPSRIQHGLQGYVDRQSLSHQQSAQPLKDSLKEFFFDNCLTPASARFTDLAKLLGDFGISSPLIDEIVRLVSNFHSGAKSGDFDESALKGILGSLVTGLKLRFPNSGSDELAMVNKQDSFLPKVLKDVVNVLERIPTQKLNSLKHSLTLISLLKTKTFNEEDKGVLNNTVNYFLNYFIKQIDNIAWDEQVKDLVKDLLRHTVPALLKRTLTNGDEVSNEEKKGVLKSMLRLVVNYFDIGAKESESLFHLADSIFSEDLTKEEMNSEIKNILDFILNMALNSFPTENMELFEEYGLSGCVDTIREVLRAWSKHLTELLNSEEPVKATYA